MAPAEFYCRACGSSLRGPVGDLRSIKREPKGVEATDFLVPRNVSVWSLLCCYLGLIGLCLPFVGFFLAAAAILFGIIGLSKRRGDGSYGSVTSDVRTIVGLVLATLAVLLWGFLGVKLFIFG